MKNKFFGYIPYDEETNKELWDKATFVFDANIFLNLYRYSNETKNQVIDCLEKISDRVWIPYQTGKEFFANRVNTILAQEKVYTDLEKSLSMKDKINSIESIRHTTLDEQKEKMIDIIKKCEKEIKNVLEEDKSNYQSLIYDDPNLNKILKVFENKVGEEPSKEEYAKYIKIIDERYKKEIPPGYKDITKSGDEKYGDAINWFEIIEFAREEDKNIIYVTDDQKEDWVEIRGGKKIGPRKELLDEFFKETGENIIGIYNTENFLKYSRKYLLPNNYDCKQNIKFNRAIDEIKSMNEIVFSGLKNTNQIIRLTEELLRNRETELKNKDQVIRLTEELLRNRETNNNFEYEDFICPDCGKTSNEGVYDAGNGFCQDCASEH
ncbi:PIN domain-containing protein [Clostridium perfringens]|uniref:PIN domain-containing protein n=1 Tax=Clostridium perfringens TaxID=1502 RepID=UPI001ABBBAEF|nr:PIN domain-containing protein [Clostridium perfringens]QTZ82831.1 hypothetical protein phiCpA_00060 [Clostridium phage phiCp-A]MBO3395129.1 DUF4935 domain-containing protein [Clostridium perfringens]MDM0478822.1 PIN domain-containing protein [Clostridium perfringens]MDM0486645.1 PIN domain-containing protein [Clostridium perfringens]MDM0640047.1 PIN domain-containing protein [Clostridium perfringens]